MKMTKENDKKSLHRLMIEDVGSLIGGCANYFDGTTIESKNPYQPKTEFGQWLKNFVNQEIKRRVKK